MIYPRKYYYEYHKISRQRKLIELISEIQPYNNEPDPVKKQAIKKEIQDISGDFFFSRFEKELKKNNGYFSGQVR